MITFRIKNVFFDRQKVIGAVDRAKRAVLSRAGAFIRRSAKGLIRARRKPSAPGSPPSSHTGILKRFIFFGYDRAADTVVIGPAATNQVFFTRHRKPVKGTVPQVLEFGGQITILEVFKYGQWQRADLRSRRRMAGLPTRYRTVTIKPRPYMAPALAMNLHVLPRLWAGSVKAA